jgi:Ca2+-binding RTX toxin-like protein
MLDAVKGKGDLTLLSGTAEANSSVSVFDDGKLVGTVTAGTDGAWSLDANVTGNVIHNFTETSTLSGETVSSTSDTLYTPAANKSLVADNGNDVLIGHPNDILMGGTGSDTFVFNPNFGHETITNFNVNNDVIDLDHTLFANATAPQVLSQTHDSAAGAVIVVDHADTITLPSVTVAQLSAHLSDFHLF